MKEKYVILRESSSRRRGPIAGSGRDRRDPTRPGSGGRRTRSARESRRRGQAGRQAVAPVIPMRLITPVPTPGRRPSPPAARRGASPP